MKQRLAGIGLLVTIAIAAVSCASSSNTAQSDAVEMEKSKPAENRFPDWYTSTRMLQTEDNGFAAYATALDTDSAKAGTKAGEQARSVLQSGVSSRLESVRNDAVVELGSDSELDSPKFLIALRNAESEIASAAEVSETEVKVMDNGNYRAFAMAYIERETLITELDKALAANGNAWNNLKDSQAFANF